MFTFLAVVLGTAIITYLLPNKYESRMKILVKNQRVDVAITPGATGGAPVTVESDSSQAAATMAKMAHSSSGWAEESEDHVARLVEDEVDQVHEPQQAAARRNGPARPDGRTVGEPHLQRAVPDVRNGERRVSQRPRDAERCD